MAISTQHLLPTALPPPVIPPEALQSLPASGPQTPGAQPAFAVSPQPAQAGAQPEPTNDIGVPTSEFIFGDTSYFDGNDVSLARGSVASSVATQSATIGEGTADVPMEILDNDDGENKLQQASASPTDGLEPPVQPPPPAHIYPGGYTIDVCFEASKLPLDVAIFNSARAAGGDEKIRKYLQAVLIIGGTALVPGMPHALESRLQAIATPLVPNMEKVQIIPPPKDVDPRVLAWKGAAVLGKMDGVADLWITAADWDILGMRGLKERCFYL